MTYIVSITSQGQISIPAQIRRDLKLDKKKALVKQEGERVVIEPVKDFFSLAGIFKDSAIKGKTAKEILDMEERVWEKVVVQKYSRSQKK